MTLLSYLLFALIAALQVGTPGPSTVYLVNNAFEMGRQRAILILLGDIAGIGVLATLSAFGLGQLLTTTPQLFMAIKLAGAVYLVWLGCTYFRRRAAPETEDNEVDQRCAQRLGVQWLRSFSVGISNPKAILFFSALFPQFTGRNPSVWELAALVLIFMAIKLVVLGSYAFGASFIQTRLQNRSIGRFARPAVGVLFLLFGGGLAYSSLR